MFEYVHKLCICLLIESTPQLNTSMSAILSESLDVDHRTAAAAMVYHLPHLTSY